MFGTVVEFHSAVRTGRIESDGGKRYFFSAVSFSTPIRVGDEFSFDGAGIEDGRRVANNLRRVERAPAMQKARR